MRIAVYPETERTLGCTVLFPVAVLFQHTSRARLNWQILSGRSSPDPSGNTAAFAKRPAKRFPERASGLTWYAGCWVTS
jgi:hypothetical protein